MKPAIRPAPSERSTANQLYSGMVPLCATAAAQAGFLGMIAPLVPDRPSFQQKYVRLPGTIIAPWADASLCRTVTPRPVARSTAAAYRNLFRMVPPFERSAVG